MSRARAWALLASVALACSSPSAWAARSAADIDAVKLDELQGTWSHVDTGETIKVTGRDLDDSRLGQARVDITVAHAANIVVAYQRHPQCFFYVTFTDSGNRANLAVRDDGQDKGVCQSGVYERVVSHAPSGMTGFVDYTGPSFDADPRKVKEDFPDGRWKVEANGITTFVVYGTLLGKPVEVTLFPSKDRSRFDSALLHMKLVSQTLRYQTDQYGDGTKTGGGSTQTQVKALCGAYLDRLRSEMVDRLGPPVGKPKVKRDDDPADTYPQPVCESEPGRWECQRTSSSRETTLQFGDPSAARLVDETGDSTSQALQRAIIGRDQSYVERQTSCLVDVILPALAVGFGR